MKTIELDYTKQCAGEPEKGHNRWHPDIPPAVEADPGEEVVMQTRHAFDGQITPTTQAADLLGTDLGYEQVLVAQVFGRLGEIAYGCGVRAYLGLRENCSQLHVSPPKSGPDC